jgi:hypothetical protein
VFHGWIQRQSVTGHLLIDVHDYSHLHQGPGILLVAHEGNFSLDLSDGRPGLVYYRKIPTSLSQTDHIVTVLRSALQASLLVENDAKLNLATDQFVVFANDRLNTSNDDASFAELKPVLSAALRQVFEGADFKLTRTSQDPKERLTITCTRL